MTPTDGARTSGLVVDAKRREEREENIMASIEYIRDRAQKAQEALAKKQATLKLMEGRIEKNLTKLEKMGYTREQAMSLLEDWSDASVSTYPILNSIEAAQDSIANAQRELPKLQEKAEEWAAKLAEAEQKEASRNVPAILKFLAMWKERVIAYYVENCAEYVKAAAELREKHDEIMANHSMRLVERRAKYTALDNAFQSRWAGFGIYVRHGVIDLERLRTDLDQEAKAKYDDIIEKVTKITGTITDAADLSIGAKGELNGHLIGENGVAKVQTIGAGGYNIVRYHFRTLIHKV